MTRQSCLILLLVSPLFSFSQEEKGCGIFGRFMVEYGKSSSGNVNQVLFCEGMFTPQCNVDSVFIDLDPNLDTDVLMKWSYRNEIDAGTPYLTESFVEWYRNDTLIDSNLYFVMDTVMNGPCGPMRVASASLGTRKLGVYDLRKAFFDMTLTVVVLREKTTLIDEVSLKIYPNPSSDLLYIEHGIINSSTVTLQNIDGTALVYPTLDSSSQMTEIDVSNLPSGIYILTFSSDLHGTIRKKISLI